MSINKLISHVALASLVAAGTIATSYAADTPTNPARESESAGSAISDSAITAKVKLALMSNKLSGISVKTELGVVSLAGAVPTEEVRIKAAKIAAAVDGVRGVDYTTLAVKAGS